jgi:hypothetical protein
MTALEARLEPDNSIIFVADPTWHYEIPLDAVATAPIVSSPSCIVIGTLAAMDGETTIKLGESISDRPDQLGFEGELETPGKTVRVIGSVIDDILTMRVPGTKTHVKVWVNRTVEPDLIIIETG